MSKSSEAHAGQDNDMQECMMDQEEQAYYKAIEDVAGFINNGAVTFDQVIESIKGKVQ